MPAAIIKQLCDFVDASPTAYHAVENIAAALEARGALRLDEGEAWSLEPGRAYFVVRAGTALVAFRPGLRPPAEEGFALAGAHTDSPALKARLEKGLSGKGFERSPVEVYGGPILSTWLDRPLSLAGRVALRGAAKASVENRLVNFARPVGIVPNLAIHLNREVNKGFEYNAQSHLPVLLSSSGAAPAEPAGSAALLRLVAEELGVEPGAILGADLYFVESQRCVQVGADPALVNGYRLDDLTGCHAVLDGFIQAPPAPHGQVACFLDNEEVGSRSLMGADSSFLRDLLGRVAALQGSSSEGFYRALSRSFSVSVDVAQAWHPSYPDKYDEAFAPIVNGGPAVKVNANMKYATDGEAEARFRLLCEDAGAPCQKWMARADMTPARPSAPCPRP
ncbi:MAG: M18 family aminopeptidase [Spirochaetaceae bacterium]|nr:M18 family aminopeptidase [Spirochaetaceae bacterium]